MRSIGVLVLLASVPACLDARPPVPGDVTDVDEAEETAGDRLGASDDAASSGGWTPLLPGSQCAEHADCDSAPAAGDGFCYRGDVGGSLLFPDEGYCTIDDGSGAVCAIDTDCPGNSRCADIAGYRLCMPACGEGGACPAGQVCISTFDGVSLGTDVCFPGSSTASDGDACAGFYDCGPGSTCWLDVENPGGYCAAYSCTLGTNAGCNGGVCIEFADGPSTGNLCVDACAIDADCREGEGYVCHDPDGAGGTPAYCRRPHAGDACGTDADCGGGWTCKTGPGWSGGYCTVTGCPTVGSTIGCGSGALCADVGGTNLCVDRCAAVGSSSTCRSGYTCVAVGAAVGGGCLAP